MYDEDPPILITTGLPLLLIPICALRYLFETSTTIALRQFGQNGCLGYPPCPYAILFMIARSLVHDVKPIFAPGWRILVVQFYCSFRYGRKCAKSGSSGKVHGDYLFSWNIIRQVQLLGLKEISRNFDNYLALMRHRHYSCPDFFGEF
jgi:hypothetical protein